MWGAHFQSWATLVKSAEGSAHLILVAGLSLYRIGIYLSAPIAAVKAGISLLHLVVASKNLSIIDVNERRIQQSKRAE